MSFRENWVLSLGWEDPLEKGMATHSSILAWEIPWTEEPGGLYSLWGHKRVGHDSTTVICICVFVCVYVYVCVYSSYKFAPHLYRVSPVDKLRQIVGAPQASVFFLS